MLFKRLLLAALIAAVAAGAAHALTAGATLTFDSGKSPLVVVCDGSPSTGQISSYAWQFSDSSSDTAGGRVVTHVYDTSGAFLLSLTVSDGTNADVAYYVIDVDGNTMISDVTHGVADRDSIVRDTMLLDYDPLDEYQRTNDGARNFPEMRAAADSPFATDVTYDGHPLIWFDETLVPAGLQINGAYMELYCWNVDGPNPRNVTAYQMTEDWSVRYACFDLCDNTDGSTPVWWNAADTPFDPVPSPTNDDFAEASAVSQTGGEIVNQAYARWDISAIFSGWYGGTPNNGLVMFATTNGSEIKFRSRDYDEVRMRPRFIVDYVNADPTAIEVVSPVGGETYAEGGQITAYWAASGVTGSVEIELVDTSVPIVVQTVSGVVNDGEHTFSITASPESSYALRVSDSANAACADASEMFTIEALPTVSIEASDADEDGAQAGSFVLTRVGTTGDLVVYVSVLGDADRPDDYALQGWTPVSASGGAVTIPDGSAAAVVTVVPIDDLVQEPGDETVVMRVGPDVSPTAHYAPGASFEATCTILDDDVPPGPFSLLLPDDGTPDQSVPPTFTWEPSTGAGSYILLVVESVDDVNSPARPLIEVTIDAPTTSFTPALGVIDYASSYVWRVTADNQIVPPAPTDCDADFAFTTAPDTFPPTVVSTSPADGEDDVDISPTIVVVFSEPMGPGTIGAFSLTDSSGGTVAISTPMALPGDAALQFAPTTDLAHDAVYVVTISTDAVDASVNANALSAEYAFAFTTGSLVSGLSMGEPCGAIDGSTGLMLLGLLAFLPVLCRRATFAREGE